MARAGVKAVLGINFDSAHRRSRGVPAVILALLMRASYTVIQVVTNVVLARALGPEEFGVYGMVYGAVGLSAALLPAGFPPALIRAVPQAVIENNFAPPRYLIRRGELSILIFSSVLAILALVAGQLGLMGQEYHILAATALVAVPMIAMTSIKEAALIGLGHVIIGQLSELLVRPLIYLALVLVLLSGPVPLTPTSAIMSLAVASAAGLASARLALSNRSKHLTGPTGAQPHIDLPAGILPMCAIGWTDAAYFALPPIILGIRSSDGEAGLFRAAMLFPVAFILIAKTLNNAHGPAFARLAVQGSRPQFASLYRRGILLGTAVAAPVLLSIVVFTPGLVRLLLGGQYEPAIGTVRILSFGYFVSACLGGLGAAAIALRREKQMAALLIPLFAAFTVAAAVVSPSHGAVGVAFALAASTCLGKFFLLFLCRGWLGAKDLDPGGAT